MGNGLVEGANHILLAAAVVPPHEHAAACHLAHNLLHARSLTTIRRYLANSADDAILRRTVLAHALEAIPSPPGFDEQLRLHKQRHECRLVGWWRRGNHAHGCLLPLFPIDTTEAPLVRPPAGMPGDHCNRTR